MQGLGVVIDHKDDSSWVGSFKNDKWEGPGVHKIADHYVVKVFDQEKLKKEFTI